MKRAEKRKEEETRVSKRNEKKIIEKMRKKVIGAGKEKKYLTGEEEENRWCVQGYFRGIVDQDKLLLNDSKY